jgi:hypothetical protein
MGREWCYRGSIPFLIKFTFSDVLMRTGRDRMADPTNAKQEIKPELKINQSQNQNQTKPRNSDNNSKYKKYSKRETTHIVDNSLPLL